MSAQAIVIEAWGPHIACHDLSGLSRQRCIHNIHCPPGAVMVESLQEFSWPSVEVCELKFLL